MSIYFANSGLTYAISLDRVLNLLVGRHDDDWLLIRVDDAKARGTNIEIPDAKPAGCSVQGCFDGGYMPAPAPGEPNYYMRHVFKGRPAPRDYHRCIRREDQPLTDGVPEFLMTLAKEPADRENPHSRFYQAFAMDLLAKYPLKDLLAKYHLKNGTAPGQPLWTGPTNLAPGGVSDSADAQSTTETDQDTGWAPVLRDALVRQAHGLDTARFFTDEYLRCIVFEPDWMTFHFGTRVGSSVKVGSDMSALRLKTEPEYDVQAIMNNMERFSAELRRRLAILVETPAYQALDEEARSEKLHSKIVALLNTGVWQLRQTNQGLEVYLKPAFYRGEVSHPGFGFIPTAIDKVVEKFEKRYTGWMPEHLIENAQHDIIETINDILSRQIGLTWESNELLIDTIIQGIRDTMAYSARAAWFRDHEPCSDELVLVFADLKTRKHHEYRFIVDRLWLNSQNPESLAELIKRMNMFEISPWTYLNVKNTAALVS